MNKKVKENFNSREKLLSEYATKSEEAIRLDPIEEDFRTPYFRDSDRILNCSSFTRYSNKTQVFSFLENDNIQTRIVHVNLVNKISRTIGRSLGLNEDLIEAIALGHDIGHCPLGHVGERILNKIAIRELDEVFMHNLQSIRNYMYLENDGTGSNLTIQTLDGIMCHNGEVLDSKYVPVKKTKEEFLKQYNDAFKSHKNHVDLIPMTLEGCVVRISDIISYVGRDIEDAIRLNFIKREDIPDGIVDVLGDKNSDIVNTLVCDIIENSLNKPYLKLEDVLYYLNKNLGISVNFDCIFQVKGKSVCCPNRLFCIVKIFITLFKCFGNCFCITVGAVPILHMTFGSDSAAFCNGVIYKTVTSFCALAIFILQNLFILKIRYRHCNRVFRIIYG